MARPSILAAASDCHPTLPLPPSKDGSLRAGIADLRFHDLRHEVGSRYLEHGWLVHHVRDLLGHASLVTTNRYLNVTTSDLLASMRRTDEA